MAIGTKMQILTNRTTDNQDKHPRPKRLEVVEKPRRRKYRHYRICCILRYRIRTLGLVAFAAYYSLFRNYANYDKAILKNERAKTILALTVIQLSPKETC